MHILFLGFSREEDIDAAVAKLPFILFAVVVMHRESAPALWAQKNGAPLIFLSDVRRIPHEVNFLLVNRSGLSQAEKNLFMKLKNDGIHGKAV